RHAEVLEAAGDLLHLADPAIRLRQHARQGALDVVPYGAEIAVGLLLAQDVLDAHQSRGDQQLGAERLHTFGERGETHLQARGLADLTVEDAHVEAVVAQHAQLGGARTRGKDAVAGSRRWSADDAGVGI